MKKAEEAKRYYVLAKEGGRAERANQCLRAHRVAVATFPELELEDTSAAAVRVLGSVYPVSMMDSGTDPTLEAGSESTTESKLEAGTEDSVPCAAAMVTTARKRAAVS